MNTQMKLGRKTVELTGRITYHEGRNFNKH